MLHDDYRLGYIGKLREKILRVLITRNFFFLYSFFFPFYCTHMRRWMSVKPVMVIISQYICKSSHHAAYLKFIQWCVNYLSIKLEKKKPNCWLIESRRYILWAKDNHDFLNVYSYIGNYSFLKYIKYKFYRL